MIGPQKFKVGDVTTTTPLSGKFVIRRLRLAMINQSAKAVYQI